MLRSLDSNTEAFLDSLSKISQRMQRAQREVATGQRFIHVSDDPDQVSTLLQARADLASTEIIQSNLGRVKAEVDGAEQALRSAVEVMERVRVLGSQGASGTATDAMRKSIAEEVGSLLERLVGLSRTTIEGRYVFSGDADHAPPYEIDLTQAAPISSYGGATATREVQHPNGTRFSVGRTALEIFDSPEADRNVFYSVNSLRTALAAADEAGIKGALGNVMGALDHLNAHLSYFGAVQNKVASAEEVGRTIELQLKTHLGSLQDADLTESILELQQAQLQQQAALESRGRMPRTTLFDYLG